MNWFLSFLVLIGVYTPEEPAYIEPVQFEIVPDAINKPKPIEPKPDDWPSCIEAPPYHQGFAVVIIGNTVDKRSALNIANDFRLEMKVRQLHGPKLWNPLVAVVPYYGNRWVAVVNGVAWYGGYQLCEWLRHDCTPKHVVNKDGTKWIAWPDWTSRGSGRTCEISGGPWPL